MCLPIQQKRHKKKETNEDSTGVTSEETTTASDEHFKTKEPDAKLEKGGVNAKESTTACRWGEHCPDIHTNPAPTESQKQNDSTTAVLLTRGSTTSYSLCTTQQYEYKGRICINNKQQQSTCIHPKALSLPLASIPIQTTNSLTLIRPVPLYWNIWIAVPWEVPRLLCNSNMPTFVMPCLVRAPHLLWSGTEFGTHPQLLIPLKPLQVIVE